MSQLEQRCSSAFRQASDVNEQMDRLESNGIRIWSGDTDYRVYAHEILCALFRFWTHDLMKYVVRVYWSYHELIEPAREHTIMYSGNINMVDFLRYYK